MPSRSVAESLKAVDEVKSEAIGGAGRDTELTSQAGLLSAAMPSQTAWLVYPVRSGLCSSRRSN